MCTVGEVAVVGGRVQGKWQVWLAVEAIASFREVISENNCPFRVVSSDMSCPLMADISSLTCSTAISASSVEEAVGGGGVGERY